MENFLWIVITGGVFAFFAAMGIGANDVANAYATSVGSKALTMKQAVGLAVIFESAGAILMGSHVSETIRKDIANYHCFESQPELLMYGCMYVVLCVGVWLFLASYFEMPVSTTHSCVGGMIGMTLVLGGSDCVIWFSHKDTFPYIGGVSSIILSWILSPIFSAIIASSIFYLIRLYVLRHSFNSNRILYLYPILIGSTITLNTFFIIYKGAKGLNLHKTSFEIACVWAFGVGSFSILCVVPFMPRLKKYVENKHESRISMTILELPTVVNRNIIPCDISSNDIKSAIFLKDLNIKNEKEGRRIIELHNNAEKFDNRTEEVFKYLQIFTAICDSFSHGANDVANSIGPFAAIFTIWKVGRVEEDSVMDENAYWILSIGGIGISLGLLLYGYKIMIAIGTKLCKITPSRGVAIELGSALVVIIGSRLKIPLSTTHCQVGATIGIGLLEDAKKCSGINCKVFAKIILGWFLTLIIVGVTTALLVAQGIYGPSIWN
jgi:sodium-dependent phosphate transporter